MKDWKMLIEAPKNNNLASESFGKYVPLMFLCISSADTWEALFSNIFNTQAGDIREV